MEHPGGPGQGGMMVVQHRHHQAPISMGLRPGEPPTANWGARNAGNGDALKTHRTYLRERAHQCQRPGKHGFTMQSLCDSPGLLPQAANGSPAHGAGRNCIRRRRVATDKPHLAGEQHLGRPVNRERLLGFVCSAMVAPVIARHVLIRPRQAPQPAARVRLRHR